MKFTKNLFTVSLVAALVAACSTTGYSTKAGRSAPSLVRAADTIPPEVVPYVPRFVEALEERGFTVGKTTDPDALELKFEFNPNPHNLRVTASLWQHGLPVLTASAMNPGWGTILARGNAVNSLAEKSLVLFKGELGKLAPAARTTPAGTE